MKQNTDMNEIQMNGSLLLTEHCAISIIEFSEKPRYEEAQDIY